MAGNSLEASGVESLKRFRYQFTVPFPPDHSVVSMRLNARRGMVRVLAACWLAAFAAFNVGIPLLDARMEHASNVVVHVEDAGATSCPVEHAPECLACQVVNGGRSIAPERTILALAIALSQVATPESSLGVRAVAARAIPSTRAPPQV